MVLPRDRNTRVSVLREKTTKAKRTIAIQRTHSGTDHDSEIVLILARFLLVIVPLDPLGEHLLRLLLELVEPRQPLEVFRVFACALDEVKCVGPVRREDLRDTRRGELVTNGTALSACPEQRNSRSAKRTACEQPVHRSYACPVILRFSNRARNPRIWCGTIPSGEPSSLSPLPRGSSPGEAMSEGA